MSRSKRVCLIPSCILLALVVVCISSLCSAQQRGGIIIRIPEAPASRCINYNTDRVWLTLYRVVTKRNVGWFTSDNQAEIILNVQIKTQPQSDKPLAFPLSTKVNIRDYGTGQVSLPVEYTVVSGLALKQGTGNKAISYTGFGVDTTVVNLQSAHGLGVALDVLDQVVGSKKLPIPDSPYSQAAGYLLDFANKVVTDTIQSHNADDKYTTASLALNFDPEGTCGGDLEGQAFETTGTKVILMSDGIQGPGYVPIDKTDEYCWKATTQPSFVLKAAHRIKSAPCADPSYKEDSFVQVTNNFVAYFLQKRQVSGHLGASNADRDQKESRQLCAALGMQSCPAAE